MSEQYQDFGDGGASDSRKKWKELRLPEDLTGKRILDMGCNAGFFCIEAAKRGATAVGIEMRKHYYEAAIENAKKAGVEDKCTFLWGGWQDFLSDAEGTFDFVLWLAAMHYEPRPAHMAKRLETKIRYKGKLVLDIGLHDNRVDNAYWGKLPRAGDMDSYPTREMLDRVFSGYVLRRMGRSTSLGGQGVRMIFHASKREPVVLLVGGVGGEGKTCLTDVIGREAITLSTDSFLSVMDIEKPEDSEFGRAITAFREKEGNLLGNQMKLMAYLNEESRKHLLEELAKRLCYHINSDFPYYVVEGGLLTFPEFHKYVKDAIGKGFRVWSCSIVP